MLRRTNRGTGRAAAVQSADTGARAAVGVIAGTCAGPFADHAMANYIVLMKIFTLQHHYDAADALGDWLMKQDASDGDSHYSRFLVLSARLRNAIARGDPARIRTACREAERHARTHGFLKELEAIGVPETQRRS